MLYWKAASKTQVKGFNIMVMIFQPQGKGFPMFVFSAVLTACVHWDMSLLPMWEALPIPSGWRFTSYPLAGGECCRAPQKKDLLVLHWKWSSSLSPTWNSASQQVHSSARGNSKPATCLPAHDSRPRAKLQIGPGTCLVFQALCVSDTKGLVLFHSLCLEWPLSPYPLLSTLSVGLPLSLQKQHPIPQEIYTALGCFKGELSRPSLAFLIFTFLPFFLFHYSKTFSQLKNECTWYAYTLWRRKREWAHRYQSSGLIKPYGKLLGTFS